MSNPLFRKVQLETHGLEAQREFYVSRLGLPLANDTRSSFSVLAGETELEFLQNGSGGKPCYHVAFNIPENRIAEALVWTESRTVVPTKPNSEAIYEFESWHSHAFYFCDPAGNLLEFIARHSLDNGTESPFNAESIQCVSEIGIATADVASTSGVLVDALNIALYPEAGAQPSAEFQSVGDENGMFVVAKRGRAWLGSEKSAQQFPLKVWTTRGVKLQLTDTHVVIH
jgi:catechol 2,3-dioxygenase-like lactoylglutathione lyase family enzyme